MPIKVTRYITRPVERELWARAAGRCQFAGCNRILYKSPVTQEIVNISEKAHIYSFSKDGPRGWGPFITNKKALNDVPNLMLMCHDCHKKIDQDKKGELYSAELLINWKKKHESRVALNTGVDPSKRSHVILYGANIGEEKSLVQPEAAKAALFPNWNPSSEQPTELDMTWEGKDDNPEYWPTEEANLRAGFLRKVIPLIENSNTGHFSIFGFAPMPLLTLLGSLFTDKIPSITYQLRREPKQSWKWNNKEVSTAFKIIPPHSLEHPPVLIISLSAVIDHNKVISLLGENISIWELKVDQPHNDLIQTSEQLSAFRTTVRQLMVEVSREHHSATSLPIFPAMPLSCAVELGRIRMPKADIIWEMYDYNRNHKGFVKALYIK